MYVILQWALARPLFEFDQPEVIVVDRAFSSLLLLFVVLGVRNLFLRFALRSVLRKAYKDKVVTVLLYREIAKRLTARISPEQAYAVVREGHLTRLSELSAVAERKRLEQADFREQLLWVQNSGWYMHDPRGMLVSVYREWRVRQLAALVRDPSHE